MRRDRLTTVLRAGLGRRRRARFLAHDPVCADRSYAFETACPESAASLWPVLIDLAGCPPVGEVKVVTVAAIKADIGLPVLGNEALCRQGAPGVPGQQFEIARVAAETAGPTRHAVIGQSGHALCLKTAPPREIRPPVPDRGGRQIDPQRAFGKMDFLGQTWPSTTHTGAAPPVTSIRADAPGRGTS